MKIKITFGEAEWLRWLILLFLSCAFLPVAAQKLTIESFEQTNDAVARARNKIGTDDKVCAAVVVRIPVSNATFDGAYIIGKPEYKNGEYILDLQHGAAQMRVNVPGYNTIDVKFREYLGGSTLQTKTTYLLTINVPSNGNNNIIDDTHQQNVRFKVTPAKAKIKINGITFDTDADGTKTIPLAIGKMQYSVSAEGYYDNQGVVETSADGSTQTINVALQHQQGMLEVRVSQDGASVKLDGVELGKSPLKQLDVNTGNHTLEVTCPNYRTEKRQITIKDKELSVEQFTLINTTEFTINSSPSGSILYIDGEKKGSTPYKVELVSGEYQLKLQHAGCRDYVKRMHLDSSSPVVSIRMSKQYQQKNAAYLQAAYQIGGLAAPAASLGAYIQNVNIEATAALGLSKSEDIYWSNGADNTEDRPELNNYTPMAVGGRVGYGLVLGTRMRLTPQLGATWLRVSSDKANSACLSASLGLRTECIVANHVGLSLCPEYSFAVGQSDNFKKLADLSGKIKGWASGFNLRLGVYVYF